MLTHGIEPDKAPIMIAPQPSTNPGLVAVESDRGQNLPPGPGNLSERLTGGRCNRNEAGDDSLNGANNRRSFEVCHVQNHPRKQAHRRADVSVQYSDSRVRSGIVRVPAVETCPAELP